MALVKAGKEEANQVAKMIEDHVGESHKDEVLARVAEEFAKTGRLRQAKKIVKHISNLAIKLDTYSRIFRVL